MPKIRVLPKNISDLIAAGEVVERPASVMKELLENSIDSGATVITAEIMNGGIKFLRVTDNGCGISREDVPTAFISHATSKIKSAEDLDGIFTLGFRGEALASICAVSKVDVLTKSENEDTGTHYCIEGGDEIAYEEAGCPNGTTIVVSDIFYNTPARMKFLKKDVSEANAVSAIIDKIALSHPEISFRFIRDGKQVMLTNGKNDLVSTVYSVLGKELSLSMIPVNYELDCVSVSGLITKPVSCRATRGMQFSFLNNRYIKSTTVMAALEQSYKNSVMVGKFPACVLNIKVDPSFVDVNVHPTKTEVRFSNEKLIFNAVYYACTNALNNLDTRVKADITRKAPPTYTKDIQPQYSQIKMQERVNDNFWKNLTGSEYRSTVSDFSDVENNSYVPKKEKEPSFLDEFYKKQAEKKTVTDNEFVPETKNVQASASENPTVKEELAVSENLKNTTVDFVDEEKAKIPIKLVGEAFKTYIIVEYGEKLILIDKHAAHERMIFNKLKNSELPSQYLFTPITVSLSKEEYSAILENTELLKKVGYTVEDFGVGTVVVRECPNVIKSEDIKSQISEIAGYLVENKSDIETERIDWLFHSAACRAAIKAGDRTDAYELEKFAETLLEDESIRYCPHGRPVLIELTRSEIEKQFGRIQ